MPQPVEIEPYYKKQAKDFVNMLFNKDLLNKDLTRECIDSVEDYLGYLFQSNAEMAIKTNDLIKKIKQ